MADKQRMDAGRQKSLEEFGNLDDELGLGY
jgi:hypothetical protein